MVTFVLLHKSFSPVHSCICLYINPEDYLSCTVYISRRNTGASLVEIIEGISELLDKYKMKI